MFNVPAKNKPQITHNRHTHTQSESGTSNTHTLAFTLKVETFGPASLPPPGPALLRHQFVSHFWLRLDSNCDCDSASAWAVLSSGKLLSQLYDAEII